MYTYTVKMEIHSNTNFSENEIEQMINQYRRDCLQWNLNPNSKQNLEFYLNEHYSNNLNDFEIDESESNIDDFYNEIEKYL